MNVQETFVLTANQTYKSALGPTSHKYANL